MYTLSTDLTMEDLMQVASENEVPEIVKKKLARAATSRIADEFAKRDSSISRKPKTFIVTVTSVETFELTDDQIFPDEIPADVSVVDVKRAIKDYGSTEEVVHDWNLISCPEWDIRIKQVG